MFAFLIELTPGQSEFIRNCVKVFALLFAYALGYAMLSRSFDATGVRAAFPKFPFHIIEYSGAFLVMWVLVRYRRLLLNAVLAAVALSIILSALGSFVRMF